MTRSGILALALGATLIVPARGDDPTPPANTRRLGEVKPRLGMPRELEPVRVDQKLHAPVPLTLPFRDEAGADVTLGDYFTPGRPVLLVLAYYRCPMLCTQVLNGLSETMKKMAPGLVPGKDYEVLTVSFDPHDTPEQAALKKENYVSQAGLPEGARSGWHFLTGDQPAIDVLTRTVGFTYYFDQVKNEFAHGSALMVLTPEGKVSRYFLSIDFDPRDLRLALVEASAGKIGSFTDQFLLLCFQYDHVTGKYTAPALLFVRAFGVLTVVILVTLFFWARHREKRAARLNPTTAG